MLKKGVIVLIVVLVAAASVLAYYLQQKRVAFIASPYTTIPMDAGLIIEAVNLPDLLETVVAEKYFSDEVMKVEPLKRFCDGILAIDSLIHSKDIRAIVNTGPVLISVHRIGRDRIEVFYSLALPPELKERHLNDLLETNNKLSYTHKEYQGHNIVEVKLRGSDPLMLYLSYVKGLLIVSRSDILVEAGIRQSDQTEDIRDLSGFRDVSAAAGKNENKLFFVFENLQKLLSPLFINSASAPGSRIAQFASAGEADLYLKRNNFVISGFIEASDTSQLLSKFSGIEPDNFDSYTIIPSSVAMFESVNTLPAGAKDIQLSTKGITRYLADIIRSQLEGEITSLYFDSYGAEGGNRMVVFKLKGQTATEKAFRDELESYNSKNGKSDSDFLIEYKPDDESKYIIYKLPNKELCSLLSGGSAAGSECEYATFYEGYLVLGESQVSISKFIYDNILKRTLANNLSYREFENTMPSRSAYYFYLKPSRVLSNLDGLFKKTIVEGLNKYTDQLKKIEAIGFQFSPSNEMLYSTLSISIGEEAVEEASTQWESLLDTVLASKPLFFTNHYTGRNEIFVQDLNDKLYLINSAGRILWKLQLDEQIIGEPIMVDFYRNKKFQILFSTRSRLHLIDRNGNYVERYPVSLRSPATNGLSVYDYENNRDYRLFICGEDRLVYLYDKSGSTIKGWNQFKTNGKVRQGIEFFRVSGKDYLILNDDENMYILDRRGNTRVKVKEQISRARGSALRLSSESSPRLVLSSKDGSIKFVSFNGDVETLELKEFSEDHVFDYFDIDSDGFGEYIIIDKGKISAFDNNGSRMFVETAGSGAISGPYGLVFGTGDRKLGYVDAGGGEIHLLDSRGKDISGFPLIGCTPFSVGKLGGTAAYNLITGGSDSFIYNYEIKR